MNRFWNHIIKPVFCIENVKNIIEIGCAEGKNTFQILDYLDKESSLTTIDPCPSSAVESIKSFENFTLIKDISLKVLPHLTNYEAVLIDGDHNWYTVYNELKIIENYALNKGKFPIVFLHDTDWPYGRRDMYYFPDNIPEKFRKPYAKKGLIKDINELIFSDPDLEKKAINKNLYNGLTEGGEKNGVLTAIEDFISETPLPLKLYNFNVNNGLGIIIDKNRKLESFLVELLNSNC